MHAQTQTQTFWQNMFQTHLKPKTHLMQNKKSANMFQTHLKQQTHLMQNIKSANMFQTHTSGQSWSILHTSGQSCFKHILLVNPSHFWSIPHTSGQSLLVDFSHVTSATSGQYKHTAGHKYVFYACADLPNWYSNISLRLRHMAWTCMTAADQPKTRSTCERNIRSQC